jgi:hypothetical protein
MYGSFSYDIVPGTVPNDSVMEQILDKFVLKPNGDERLRCDLLSDTFICEITNLNDFESVTLRLSRLRSDLDEQFNFTFTLHSRGAPIKIRGTHNASLANQIIEA